MIQQDSSTNITNQILRTSDDETFTYNGNSVKIITVFTDGGTSIALVEDENGELFEVPKDSLR